MEIVADGLWAAAAGVTAKRSTTATIHVGWRQALRKNGVASREDAEFVSLLERYRNDIVEAE